MKNTRLDNPAIIVQDERIVKLDKVVEEVKQSEEWEAVKMNILDIGIQKGRAEGLKEGLKEGRAEGLKEGLREGRAEEIIESCMEFNVSKDLTKAKLVQKLSISEDEAEKYMQKYWKD